MSCIDCRYSPYKTDKIPIIFNGILLHFVRSTRQWICVNVFINYQRHITYMKRHCKNGGWKNWHFTQQVVSQNDTDQHENKRNIQILTYKHNTTFKNTPNMAKTYLFQIGLLTGTFLMWRTWKNTTFVTCQIL